MRSPPPVITNMFKSRSLLKDLESVSGTTMSTSNNLPFFFFRTWLFDNFQELLITRLSSQS